MENFDVSQSAGTCGEGAAAWGWAGFCQDGCQPCGFASLVTGTEAKLIAKMHFFFFTLDNFCLPAPEGLLMTPTKPHTWGPCVPVNEGTVKGSVVELGCGGKWGARWGSQKSQVKRQLFDCNG